MNRRIKLTAGIVAAIVAGLVVIGCTRQPSTSPVSAPSAAGHGANNPSHRAALVLLGDPNPCNADGAVCGTIRWASATSWTTIEDSAHHASGIDSVQVFTDHLRVNYGFTATTVASMQVTPDESFTAAGVRVGASVGLDHADLYFYMGASQTPVNPALLTRAGANVWITGFMNVT